MNHLKHFSTPQLGKIQSGKVRDSFRLDDKNRLIVVTDRISAFDKVLKSPIPYKGAVLNKISNYWFDKSKDIIGNHLVKEIDPNINVVREAQPIKLEMIVRGYLTGSMWRGYRNGKRRFSGVEVGDGMKKNDRFPQPIITPTTKGEIDMEITPELIIEQGLVYEDVYRQMEKISLRLFEQGTNLLAEKGIILVDTKYEFGFIDGNLALIDEIHTPDSSRFWYHKDYETNKENVQQIDKEFTRQWLIENKINETTYPDELPAEIVNETSKRYLEIYEAITEEALKVDEAEHIKARMYKNLVKSGIIKDGYVAIFMGSPSDLEHCQKLQSYIDKYDIMTDLRVVSAHKNGEDISRIAEEYNNSVEPGVVVAVAGRSNGLGGALAANLNIPVINCPPFKDKVDMSVNINSSLMMPSKTPATTSVQLDNAALAAMRSLNLYRLREAFDMNRQEMKDSLKESDKKIRGK
jgi:fusion protein PurCD